MAGSEWDDYAEGWDDDEGARAYAGGAHSALLTLQQERELDLATASVLDFGCGTGLLTELLVPAGATVLGVDTSEAMLAVLNAKAARNEWSTVRTSTELPTTPATYDLVVCSSVCSFLDDYPGTAQALAALLRPGGLFVQWDWELDQNDPDGHGLRRSDIAAALAAAGLTDISINTGFSVPMGGETMEPLMGVGVRPTV